MCRNNNFDTMNCITKISTEVNMPASLSVMSCVTQDSAVPA